MLAALHFLAQFAAMVVAVPVALRLERQLARARWKRKNAARVADVNAMVRRRTFVAERLAVESQLQRAEQTRKAVVA